jgi:hypothetical protein
MEFVQQAHDFPPQAASCATQPCTTTRQGEILTRPPGGNDSSFCNKSNCSKVIAGHFRYVIELVGVGEMPCADSGCGGVDLHGGNSGCTGTFKGQRKPADTVKQRHQCQVTH